MRNPHVDPHQLVERLEKKYQKKTRFQKYKNFTSYVRRGVFNLRNASVRVRGKDAQDLFDYELIG